MDRPVVAVTIGDPAGIGPEIAIRAAADGQVQGVCRPVLVGSRPLLDRVARALSIEHRLAAVDVRHVPGAEEIEPGAVQPEAGRAAARWIEEAVGLVVRGEAAALATAPINKDALRAGGVPHLDHTEMLKALTGSRYVMTMFVLGNLRIFFATRHQSLLSAIQSLTVSSVAEALVEAAAALGRFGMPRPRFALAALNPHAGEGGMFGDEEERILGPAVEAARRSGVDVAGPIPADSVFHLCRLGRYDAVMSLFHDQGHIAAKSIDFEGTVAITTGLPFVRSSVDHGTAFDIAWRGKASHAGMQEAILAAAEYSGRLPNTLE